MKTLSPKAKAVYETLDSEQRERADRWLERHPGASPYRTTEALCLFSRGAVAVSIVESLTPYRGAPRLTEHNVAGAHVVIRPARGGSWGKSVEHRVLTSK